jgi:uncharacterized membrane protein YhaH (DUF805 family)
VSVLADLKRLTQFAGREPRREFWPYVGVVYLADIVVGQVVMIPMMSRMMQRVAMLMTDPEFMAKLEANPFQAQGAMFSAMADEMQWVSVVSMASGAILLVLLAAAVSRRLHDSGLSAWWGLLPVPLAVVHMALMPSFFSTFGRMFSGSGEPDTGLFTLFFLNNTLGLAALVTLIVLLCRRSAVGANKFSAAPA